MTECKACGEKAQGNRAFPSAVIEINNPEQLVLLRKVVMPATLPEADNPPAIGKYRNVILKYEDTGNVYIYSSDGIPTAIEANVPQEILDKITDLEEDIETEETRRISADDALRSSINTVSGNLSTEISARQSADTAIRGDLTTLTGRVTTAEGDIDTIEGKIPNQATAQNQLADKNFVNSSIATNTANFIGTFNSVAELEAYTGTVTNNDYAFVIVTDAQGNTAYDRYKYNGDTEQWMFEYELNNSSFTAEQWAAINSGITSGNVDKLSGLANIKTIGANLNLSQAGELSATDTTYTAGNGLNLNGTQFSVNTTTIATQSDLTTGLATKQNTLTAGSNIQISNDTISATDTTYSDFVGTDGTSAGTSGLVPAPATTDAGKVLGANGNWVTGGPPVRQTLGTSTSDVMSQNAVTSSLFADPGTNTAVRIGSSRDYAGNTYSVAIGNGASSATGGVAIGAQASSASDYTTATNNSIAIGPLARAIQQYTVAIGPNAFVNDGNEGIALGHSAYVRGNYSTAIGVSAKTASSAAASTAIGYNSSAQSAGSIAIGGGSSSSYAETTGAWAIAIGGGSRASGSGSIAIGNNSEASMQGEMNIGLPRASASSQASYGYNGSAYRLLTGLYDPQSAHDAATKGYVDTQVSAIGAGTRRATSSGWNTSSSLDYILQKSSSPSSAQGAMFYTGKDLSDFPIYAGIGIYSADTGSGRGPLPYLLTQTTSDDGQGTTSGDPAAYRMALYSEIPATFTTNEWDALWA